MARIIDFRDWLSDAAAQGERVRAVEASFAEPYRRERPRDPDEADFLRLKRTPQRLIGPSPDDAARRAFAAPQQSGFFRGIDLSLLDPQYRDERRLLIEAEHPELAGALEPDEEGAIVTDDEANPRLHVTLHEIVAEQLWEDDPPEAWQTARRLLAAGYERHEIFHMLGSALVPQLWRALRERQPAGRDEYVRALAALPASWEDAHIKQRDESESKRKLAVKVRKAARIARKRNRRKR